MALTALAAVETITDEYRAQAALEGKWYTGDTAPAWETKAEADAQCPNYRPDLVSRERSAGSTPPWTCGVGVVATPATVVPTEFCMSSTPPFLGSKPQGGTCSPKAWSDYTVLGAIAALAAAGYFFFVKKAGQ